MRLVTFIVLVSALLASMALAQAAPPGPPTDPAVSGACAAQPGALSRGSDRPTTVSFNNVGNFELYAFWYDKDGVAGAATPLPPRSTTGPLPTTQNTVWVVTDEAGKCYGSFMPVTPNAETYKVGVADNPIKRVVQPIVSNPLIMFGILVLVVGSAMGWKASSMIQKRAESRKLVDDSPDFHKDKYEVGKAGYFRQRKE